MKPLRTILKNFVADQRGTTMIEYGFIASLIAIGIIAGVTAIGAQVSAMLQSAADGFKS